jgi:hypothetical protein
MTRKVAVRANLRETQPPVSDILFVMGGRLRLVRVWQYTDAKQRSSVVEKDTAEQAGWVLNCQAHDIPALISARLLKPLGNPAQNSTKFFATADVLETAKDRAWLVKMTTAINTHWQHQNARAKNHSANGTRNGVASLTLNER